MQINGYALMALSSVATSQVALRHLAYGVAGEFPVAFRMLDVTGTELVLTYERGGVSHGKSWPNGITVEVTPLAMVNKDSVIGMQALVHMVVWVGVPDIGRRVFVGYAWNSGEMSVEDVRAGLARGDLRLGL